MGFIFIHASHKERYDGSSLRQSRSKSVGLLGSHIRDGNLSVTQTDESSGRLSGHTQMLDEEVCNPGWSGACILESDPALRKITM